MTKAPAIAIAVTSYLLTAADMAMAEGRFVVRPAQVENAELRTLADAMGEAGVLEESVKALNQMFRIPRDVGVKFLECGESNAYFSAEDMEISMCIELWADMDQTLRPYYEDEDEHTNAVVGAFLTILMHEVGHALVAVLDLPITGREEDAVDQLAAWVLIETGEAESVLGSAATYYTAEQAAEDDDLADEHSLNQQRYYNMVCWVYGSDTQTHADLVEEWELPQARAEQCEGEYQTLRKAWSRLLQGSLRNEPELRGRR